MKIALVVFQFIREKGGVEGYVVNLAHHLLERGHEVHVFAHRFGPGKEKRLVFHPIPAITCWSPLKYWTFARNAPKTIKETGIKFDLVHGFTQTLSQDVYRVGGGCHWDYMMHTYPLMQSVFGRIFMCLNPRHASLLLLERSIFYKRRYKQVTCISEQCKKEIVRHYKLPENSIEVIYNAVDIQQFTPQNKSIYRDAVRSKYGVLPDEILLLFVGSGFKRKGLRHVIDALSLLGSMKTVKLLVAGRGKTERYRRLAREKGLADRLVFAGVCGNIQEMYAAGDIFVFPSEYDAFGTACLEAMASGLPVIASKASGVSEIITHGKDGFVINHPISPNEMAKYMRELLEEGKRGLMGLAARQTAEAYTFDANVGRTLRVYEKISAAEDLTGF